MILLPGALPTLASAGVAALALPWLLWLPSLVAMLAYGAAIGLPDSAARTVRSAMAVGWFAQAAAIFVDIAGIGSDVTGARFGFAPALSATVWMVVTVYALESRELPQGAVRRALAGCAAAVVLLASVFPGQFRPHGGSPWAPVHWVLGLASYGLFGAAVLHALLQSAGERRMRSKTVPASGETGVPLLRLERLTFRFVAAGFFLLTAAIAFGWWVLPGARWDHKTVFSLLAWGVFAGLLAGRTAFGWRGRRATRWLYVGAGLLLLGYAGSRFVLEVVLRRVAGA
jgi:ABC-type uncharacterized transport system permease subunit